MKIGVSLRARLCVAILISTFCLWSLRSGAMDDVSAMDMQYGDLAKQWPEERRAIYEGILARILDVSMIRVLAAPEQFDGKAVRVIGVISFRTEDAAIYLDRESFDNFIAINSIRISGDFHLMDKCVIEGMNGRYAFIEGVFEADYPVPRAAGAKNGRLVDVLPVTQGNLREHPSKAAEHQGKCN